ncbi:CAP domain-containing protein [Bacillus sp. FJAT-22090]|uniref:CAP domain-containing protein n=1 Tax=Bacillus sp. FJAT-22090 TaxID=1581038 RepID=UPI0016427E59|nr:CAP-associated domain-containing protein [Bacillus sp. FJAT-22090]
MKNLFRILIVITIVLVVFIYFDNPVQENELITGSNNSGQLIPQEYPEIPETANIFDRPQEGISTLIGEPAQKIVDLLGKPSRIEASIFDYDWWVYNDSLSTYTLFGVADGLVTQVFAIGNEVEVNPYKIGQSLTDIYRFTIVESEITMSIDSNTYTFSLTEEDINNRILVPFDDLFAILYIDMEDHQLEAVRFSDAKTLLKQKPYDILYNGTMIEAETPASSLQAAVDRANERQIVEITNVFRLRHGSQVLVSNFSLQQIARTHSEEMAKNNIVVNEKFEVPKFSDKLKESSIQFTRAGGNTAAFYFDAGEAVNGWLNSKDHRATLLDEAYNQTGVGVYGNYYTQNLIEQNIIKEKNQ